jgi:hypothetical protein
MQTQAQDKMPIVKARSKTNLKSKQKAKTTTNTTDEVQAPTTITTRTPMPYNQ